MVGRLDIPWGKRQKWKTERSYDNVICGTPIAFKVNGLRLD